MSAVNTDELELALMVARQRVLKIQTKLHRWASDDPHRRFDDLFNLVADSAFLLVAWDRVSGNKGAATAGVDRRTASTIAAGQGVEEFLGGLPTGRNRRIAVRHSPSRRRRRTRGPSEVCRITRGPPGSHCIETRPQPVSSEATLDHSVTAAKARLQRGRG